MSARAFKNGFTNYCISRGIQDVDFIQDLCKEALDKSAILGALGGGISGAIPGGVLGAELGIPASLLYERMFTPENERDYWKAAGKGALLGGSLGGGAGALGGGYMGGLLEDKLMSGLNALNKTRKQIDDARRRFGKYLPQ